jgi:branched-chain amino acid transport system ATP-binding protein
MARALMLEVRNISASYGKIQALFGLSLAVNVGEIVTLIGVNGAGKTTTLNSISGIIKPWQGEILFDGRRLDKMSPSAIVRLGIMQVPEGRRIFPGLTVGENLEMGAVTRRLTKEGMARDMEQVFSIFPRLKERVKQRGWSLSGGEQQMLAVGRAMMAKPKLILFDEPSLGLAPVVVDTVLESIVKLNRDLGTTVLLVEQNAYMALTISHRAYILENGTVRLSGNSRDLLDNKELTAAYFGLGSK